MITEKQKKVYVIIVVLIVLALLGGQYALHTMFTGTIEEVDGVNAQVAAERKTRDHRQALLDKYKEFEALVTSSGRPTQMFPETPMELFAVIDSIMKANSIEHTNKSSSSATVPGGVIQLELAFSGTYYNILKALAALRESAYVMRVSNLRITAEDALKISGSVTILSNAKDTSEE